VAFRNLAELGFSEAEIKALAASYQVKDGPNDDGDMFERPGKPSDRFPSPYANEQQARATHNGAYPPDLSLIVKARPDGANYLYSLLTGYGQPPEGVHLGDGQHYNPYFPGGALAMIPPLSDGQVAYEDGTQASIDQMSRDVVNFLQWAAEPEMQARKQLGIKVLIFLAVFTAFMYLAKRNLWRKLH
jgi:ubiquinol-cytochrome c reductase cytochrome c1 subunit